MDIIIIGRYPLDIGNTDTDRFVTRNTDTDSLDVKSIDENHLNIRNLIQTLVFQKYRNISHNTGP